MPQLYVLTGENTYELLAERKRWIAGFAVKHGEENCSRLEGKGLKFRSLLDEVSVLPFTAEKRLVVVEGVPDFEREEMERLTLEMHPDVLLLFVDPAPDRRRSGVKALLAVADVREFPVLSGVRLKAWIAGEIKAAGAELAPGTDQSLIDVVGEDQLRLAHEIHKLAAFAGQRAITSEDVRLLSIGSREQHIWRLLDHLATGDRRAALSFARELLEHGESAGGIWNILLWSVAQLTAVAGAVEDGARTPQQVVAKSGVKFGPARSLLPLARRLSPVQLRSLVDRIARFDIALKTGALRSSVEAPEEIEAVMDLCVAELCVR